MASRAVRTQGASRRAQRGLHHEGRGAVVGCPDCGLLQSLPQDAPPASAAASCLRCDAVLRRWRAGPAAAPLALCCAALALSAATLALPLLSIDIHGQMREATLSNLPAAFWFEGRWELAAVTFACAVALPPLRAALLTCVLVGLRLRPAAPLIPRLMRWQEGLRRWAMPEVFAIGLAVAYARLGALAFVEPGPALYALGGLLLAGTAAEASLDREAVWDAMRPPGHVGDPAPEACRADARPIRCASCALVVRTVPGAPCPRCGAVLHPRKPGSLPSAAALLAAAAVLYLPANALPVLTTTYFGRAESATILGGAWELFAAGQWPLAVVIFVASVCVPLIKLVGLGAMIAAARRAPRRDRTVRELTWLFRIVEAAGRWSMIDVFVLATIVGLVQAGAVARVAPGLGAPFFAATVVLTMVAASAFDPRLMWDAAEREASKR